MSQRRLSKEIRIGDVTVGGGAPIVVQSMTSTDTRDVEATVEQVARLVDAGCEIVRLAVPDAEAAAALGEVRHRVSVPLVADIHFDHRLALEALRQGVDGLRLNPGNIRRREHVVRVVEAARERGVPIRIGVNFGSLPPAPPDLDPTDMVGRMVRAALDEVALLESLDFDLIKLSLKAFDVPTTVEAYRTIAGQIPYPLHVGITEAGTPWAGTIRSATGIGIILYEGLGDTIRVSLTGDPVREVEVAYEILKALNLRHRGATLVSCPVCGRSEIDLEGLALEVERRLKAMGKTLKVAVMGCVVNGPGEARDADVGLAGGKGRGVIFRKGRVLRTVREDEFLEALMAEVEAL